MRFFSLILVFFSSSVSLTIVRAIRRVSGHGRCSLDWEIIFPLHFERVLKKSDSLNSMVPRGLKHIHSRELEFIPNWLATSWFVRNFSYGRNRLNPIIPVDCPCGVWWIYCAGEWARDMISHIETKMLCMINGCLSWSNKVNIDGLSVGECLCVYRCCHLL